MSKVRVCDFCRRGSFIGTKIKVRGKRWGFVPGMLSAATYKLELCDSCYDKMVDYIENKTLRTETLL